MDFKLFKLGLDEETRKERAERLNILGRCRHEDDRQERTLKEARVGSGDTDGPLLTLGEYFFAALNLLSAH